MFMYIFINTHVYIVVTKLKFLVNVKLKNKKVNGCSLFVGHFSVVVVVVFVMRKRWLHSCGSKRYYYKNIKVFQMARE